VEDHLPVQTKTKFKISLLDVFVVVMIIGTVTGWYMVYRLMIAPTSPPDDKTIQTAIAKTQAALPSATSTIVPTTKPTSTVAPTIAPTKTVSPPTQTPEPTIGPAARTATVTSVQLSMSELIASYLKKQVFIKTVNLVRFQAGELQIEYLAQYIPEANIRDDHFVHVVWISNLLKDFTNDSAAIMAGGEFKLVVTTLFQGEGGKYQSTSYFDTLTKLRNSQISYAEWVKEANAK
jgi:hypothetical protein